MTDLINYSSIILNGPSDWERWISVIEKFATSQGVWSQIDPSNQSPVPCLKPPQQPQLSAVNSAATDVTALNSEQMRVYEFLYNRYRTGLQNYRDQQKSLSLIQQHIIKTIGNYYSTIANEHDVAKELLLLKKRVQPSDWILQRESLFKYQTILNSPDRTDIST